LLATFAIPYITPTATPTATLRIIAKQGSRLSPKEGFCSSLLA
jgi:hypothetical protein